MSAPSRAGWTVAEVAEMFNVDKSKVYELINTGEIPADRFGATYRIPNAWVQERRGLDLNPDELQERMHRAAVRALTDLLGALTQLVRGAGDEFEPAA